MYPEAVPVIDQDIGRIPRLVFTSKLAIEINNEVNTTLVRKIKSLGKEVIGIARINDELHAKIPRALNALDRSIIILGPSIGYSWLRYVTSLVNTIVGLTLDALAKFIELRPHLLNLPNELFIDPIISNRVTILPGGIPKSIINWLIDYVDSGGDLYVLIRGSTVNSIDLASHSRLVFTYDIKSAEIYNSLIRDDNKLIINANCDFCGKSINPLCILLCPGVDLVREMRVD